MTGIDINQNEITLNGIYRFNVGDEIWIIDDATNNSQYLSIGSLDSPSKYKIALVNINDEFESTTITVLSDLSDIASPSVIPVQNGFDIGLRVVSKFSNTSWYNGLWYNGIFEGGEFLGGMWYNGTFIDGDWGQ